MAEPVKYKILFADDEPNVVILIKRRLESHGYDVVTAVNGQETLEKAKKEKPDLIVLDHSMPVLNGHEACLGLKKDPQTKDISIVILTASESTVRYWICTLLLVPASTGSRKVTTKQPLSIIDDSVESENRVVEDTDPGTSMAWTAQSIIETL